METFHAHLKNYCKRTDLLLLLLALISCMLGLVFIYSATLSENSNRFMIVQIGAIILGVIAFIVMSFVDFENFSRFWPVFFVLNILLICSVIILGEAGDSGNKSWIRFAGIGIQPAEFGKLIYIFTLSCHVSQLKDRLNALPSVIRLVLHGIIPVACVYLSSGDLGMALAYIFIFAIMIFLSGISKKWIAAFVGLSALAVPVAWKFMAVYQKARILVTYSPAMREIEQYKRFYYQTQQSQIAIGAGKLFGSGYMQGRQTQYNMLPAKYTDSIFSVVGEEFGLVGCCVVIILLAAIISRIFYNGARCDSSFGRMACCGIGSMFMVQSVINIGMCVGVLPVIGLTLPFFSYGGSSVLTMFMSLGIVAGFALRRRPTWLRGGA